MYSESSSHHINRIMKKGEQFTSHCISAIHKSTTKKRKMAKHLQLMIRLRGGVLHGVAVRVETERREERHEEGIGEFRIRNPNHFSALDFVEERPHHPVLNAVLLLQPPIGGPRWPVVHGDGCLRRIAAVNHANVEAAREIVHEDPKR